MFVNPTRSPWAARLSIIALIFIIALAPKLFTDSVAAQSHDLHEVPEIIVNDAWVRPGLDGGNSAIYFTLVNPSEREYTLIAAASEAAATVEIHETHLHHDSDDHGHMSQTMHMHQLDSISIAANEEIHFSPGGLHIMLIDLEGPLALGDEITFDLYFDEAAAPVTATAELRPF